MRSRGPIQSMRSYGTLLSKNVATDPAPPYPCRDAPHLQVFPCNTSLNIVGTPSVWLYLAFFLIGVGTILPRVVGAYRGVERSLVASGSAVWRRGSGRRPGVDRHQAQPFIRPRAGPVRETSVPRKRSATRRSCCMPRLRQDGSTCLRNGALPSDLLRPRTNWIDIAHETRRRQNESNTQDPKTPISKLRPCPTFASTICATLTPPSLSRLESIRRSYRSGLATRMLRSLLTHTRTSSLPYKVTPRSLLQGWCSVPIEHIRDQNVINRPIKCPPTEPPNTQETPCKQGVSCVAGAGFEPATFGL